MSIIDNIRKRFAPPSSISVQPRLGGKTNGQLTREIGEAGTEDFHGFITQDYNSKFHGDKAVDIYEEMRRSDATVNAVLSALKLPILAAPYMFESADTEDENANEQANFIKQNLEGIEGGFKSFLRESMTHLDFGFHYSEKVYKIKDGKIQLKKLAPRMQTAHYRWRMQDNEEEEGITQMLPSPKGGSGSMRSIPMSKLVIFSNNKEGDNNEGVSILRSAYKHWYLKDLLYKIDGIRHERGAGILVVGLPAGSSNQDRTDAENLGKNFKLNEQGYIIKPSTDWTVELLTAGIESQGGGLITSVEHHDRSITMNILAQFLSLGSGDSGSFALSKDQSNFFTLSLRAIADYMEGVINEQIIKPLILLNFGEQEVYPTFRFQTIGEIDYDEMSQVIERLTNAGLVKNDPQLKVWIHNTFGLPKVTVEDFEAQEAEDAKKEKKKEKERLAFERGKREVGNGKPVDGFGSQDDGEVEEDDMDDAELAEKKRFRALTLAEERVAFAEVESFMDDEEAELQEELDRITEEQKAKIMRDAERIITSGDIAAVTALTLAGIVTLKKRLQEVAKKSLEKGKATAAKEVTKSIPTTSKFSKKVLETKVEMMIAARTQAVENAVKGSLLNALNNEIGRKPALAAVEAAFDKYVQQSNTALTGRLVTDFFNEGRAIVFESHKEVIHGLQWSAILDQNTCFPAGTQITTENGEKPIEDILMGEKVLTRKGWKKVLNTMNREYTDAMVIVETPSGGFSCTADHPVFSNGGWKEARDLRVGDILMQQSQDDSGQVVGIGDDSLRDSDKSEAVAENIGSLASVSNFISVPVRSVRLYTNVELWKKEVDRVTSKFGFLNEVNTELANSNPNLFFKSRFAHEPPITRNGTVATRRGLSGRNSKSFTAILTQNKNGGTATRFRTNSTASVGRIKLFTTPTNLINNLIGFAVKVTETVSVGIGSWYGESFKTADTNLIHPLTFIPTLHRTELAPPILNGVVRTMKGFFARRANRLFTGLFGEVGLLQEAFAGAVGTSRSTGIGGVGERLFTTFTNEGLVSHKEVKNNSTLTVYNIEVEDAHEYFANGYLVHNCNVCLSLDGRVFNVNDPFTNITQVHSACRCIMVGVLKTDSELPPIKQLPKTLRNRFETVEGVPSTNNFEQLKKPIVRKGSALDQKIQDGDITV